MAKKILPVVMCGGAGTRMWPESRESLPKQFIPLIGDRSTFQRLMTMLAEAAIFEPAIVVTNVEYRFRVAEQLQEIGVEAEIVLEPSRRDSGPAVAAAAELALRRSPDSTVAMLAADHIIRKPDVFVELCARAAAAAGDGSIVTFGVTPDAPATGFGYIRPGARSGTDPEVRKVAAFVEKPDAATAARYLAEGYLWNSGNFIFRADAMRDEIAARQPAMAEAARNAVTKAKHDLRFLVLDAEAFSAAPKISIDYAVMEKTDRAAVIAADFGWSDIGAWSTVFDLERRDGSGNAARGAAVVLDSRDTYVRSDEVLTAVVGVSGLIVVTTGDAVLVVDRARAGEVKQLVEELKRRGRPEASEHRRSYRPWGYYQSIDRGARYQVKRIVVKPGGRLSLQKHFHRAEHWVVVRGAAEVTRDAETVLVHENESIYLPIGCTHRMANPGKIDLELIEVQVGSYLGEDDIIRIEDVYNRG